MARRAVSGHIIENGAILNMAHWLYVQRYFEQLRSYAHQNIDGTYTVRININNTVSVTSVKR